jgi:hypothetical protein
MASVSRRGKEIFFVFRPKSILHEKDFSKRACVHLSLPRNFSNQSTSAQPSKKWKREIKEISKWRRAKDG